jgi:predicted amidohydrolase YtcJ
MSWGSGKLQYLPGHIKLFTDGAMYSQNMVMRDGYIDGHQGAWLMQEKIYREVFRRYWDAGYQIHIHQNGDAGLDRLLDVLEENLTRNPRVDHRTVIVHFGYSAADQVARIKRLGAIVSANPYYVTALSDLYSRQGIGASRSEQMVRLGDVQRAGIVISLHSDMPMAPGAPLQLMHAAVNRINFANKVAGPDQRISPEQALRAVTSNAAYTLRMEKDYGSISIGKHANFTLLGENPLTTNPLTIKEIEVRGTMVEGRHFPIK